MESLFGYISYALSAYALTVLVIGIPGIVARTKAFIYGNKYGNRYMTDIPFRVIISLYFSLAINVLYAAVRLIAGIYYGSFWFGAEAIFYIVLSLVRFTLLGYARTDDDNQRLQHKKYRFCGYLLFALNVALTGVVYQMINHGMGYHYPGLLIYAAAAFAFCCLTLSIIHMVKYRKLNNPILSASKIINLAKALVALFALQTAMFASFGGDMDYERIMNSFVGGGVCLAIFGMAVFLNC
jgi:divalent metal cation (Fe/Co/Zn/Cd) transporter